jgi:hypothetical protein
MAGSKSGGELFVYMIVVAITATCCIVLSMVAGLSTGQTLSLTIGGSALVWAAVFTLVKFNGAWKTNQFQGPGADLNIKRVVIVEPPTGEPYPHHEDHAGSEGKDQGQLTCHLPGSTPLVGRGEH